MFYDLSISFLISLPIIFNSWQCSPGRGAMRTSPSPQALPFIEASCLDIEMLPTKGKKHNDSGSSGIDISIKSKVIQ